MEYWSWWASAIALSTLTLGFWAALKSPLGVSGSWARVVMYKNDHLIHQAEAPFHNNPQLLNDALMAATIDAFGQEAVEKLLASRGGVHTEAQAFTEGTVTRRTAWTSHLTFLVMLLVGGLISAAASGQLSLRLDLGSLHQQLFGIGIASWMTLFVGGTLVGFGTQMAGGCTSGHALSGCPRLVPASLLATAVFFSTAVGVSLLISFAAKGVA
jgi:uncharacterized protein